MRRQPIDDGKFICSTPAGDVPVARPHIMVDLSELTPPDPAPATSTGARLLTLGVITSLILFVAFVAGMIVYSAAGYFDGPWIEPTPPGAPRSGPIAAVMLSGDMGFRHGMSGKVLCRLRRDHIPVVAINSLAYYRERRSPAQTEAILATAMHRAIAESNSGRVVLIGQSFGADMLHVGLSLLPPHLRRHVAGVVLIVPGDSVIYKASPAELFNLVPPDAPAISTARALSWAPVTCIYGTDEPDSLCPGFTLPNVRRIGLPGGHSMNHDIDTLYRIVGGAVSGALRAVPPLVPVKG
jgi:hypothetical protein